MTDFIALQAAIIKGSREEVVAIVTAAIREHADVNALLDKGMIPAMRDVVDHFHGRGIKIIIGGAPVTQAYCDAIGADGYSEDANGAVKLVDQLLA